MDNTPFIVGVLGHRDLHPADVPVLREAVSAFIGELKQHLPDTELRIIVGSSAGADLLVAQAALALRVRVDAILPMPLEEYAAKTDSDELKALKNLLENPEIKCTVLHPTAHPDGPEASTVGEQRATEAILTESVIRRSALLLALWDGHPSPRPGDTADTLLRYLGVRTDGNHSETSIVTLDEADELDSADRLVYWTPTSQSAEAPAGTDHLPGFLRSVGDNRMLIQRHMPEDLAQQLEELNNYNSEYRQLLADGCLRTPDSLLASLPADAPIDDQMLLEDIDAQYGKADALAVHYQTRSNRLFHLFGVMAFTMGLAYLVYDKFREWSLLLIVYLFLLLSSVAVYYFLRGKRWFAKHLTYRALAETMRAQFYLRLAGLDSRVDAARVLALSGIDHFHGFSLISYVLASVAVADVYGAEQDHDPRRSRCIEQTWIESQHRYFVAKVQNLERESLRVNALKQTMFIVILLVVVAMSLFNDVMEHYNLWFGVSLKNMLTFWMGFLALVLGIWQLHESKMASRELLWQYRNQRNHFARARKQLSRLTSTSRRNEVLVNLGRNSLMESYLWTIHRYHREHEPPARA